jgi:hypothetical protein
MTYQEQKIIAGKNILNLVKKEVREKLELICNDYYDELEDYFEQIEILKLMYDNAKDALEMMED